MDITKIRDCTCRILAWTYRFENAEKSELNDVYSEIEYLKSELDSLLE